MRTALARLVVQHGPFRAKHTRTLCSCSGMLLCGVLFTSMRLLICIHTFFVEPSTLHRDLANALIQCHMDTRVSACLTWSNGTLRGR